MITNFITYLQKDKNKVKLFIVYAFLSVMWSINFHKNMHLSVCIMKSSIQWYISYDWYFFHCPVHFYTGYGDLKFNWLAYVCGGLSNLSQSLYLLLVQRYCEKDISTVETLQLNSVNTLPFLTMYMFLNGEVFMVTKYSPEQPISFFVIFIFAVSMGCLLNYTLFLCTSLTSALTTSVVGGLKAMVQTLFGLFTFGGISHNLPTYIGISMNLSGGVWYIYEKYAEGQRSGTGSNVMKKITSLSTAEDFHKLKTQQSSVANGVKLTSHSNLQSISEEIHERHHQSHSNDTVISFDQKNWYMCTIFVFIYWDSMHKRSA